MGQFYLDLYPREGKFGHAACFPIMTRHSSDVGVRKPIAAMVVNFDETLKHSLVTTFFHEFGHVMHNLCQEVNHSLLNMRRSRSFGVETDFVEMPS